MNSPSDIDLNHHPDLPKRPDDANKGYFGNALLIGGCKGMAGAITLATKACLRGGVGKVYSYATDSVCDCLQISAPEAICLYAGENLYQSLDQYDLAPFSSIAVGPGLGQSDDTRQTVLRLLDILRSLPNRPPLVMDADALNLLALQKDWETLLPDNSILTPHPKEWERLCGINANSRQQQIEKARDIASQQHLTIVLKGHETFIAFPDGTAYVNHTGNHGMAKGGSGDVLTGILASLLAQPIDFKTAVIMSVFLHGRAGDIAALKLHPRSMTATDIIDNLSSAFNEIDPN